MNGLIAFALRQRALVVILFLIMLGGGLFAFSTLNIEAYPDPVPPMVNVVTQNPGQPADEIERYVTIPIEVATAGLPGLKTVRTISVFGLSDVKLQFTFDVTYEEARQQVLNRLAQLPALPNGAQPSISPTSPIGEIYRYQLVGPPGFSVMDLKTIQEWMMERRFKAVPGVVDVISWGGKTKTYDITIDLERLNSYGLTLPKVLEVLTANNVNVGGNTVNIGPQSAVVRGVGLVKSMDDIRNTMISQSNGTPVLVRDVAEVTVGFKPRLGIAGQNAEDDIVQGIVLMRRGAESKPTIERVKAEVEHINSSNLLPPGVKIERIYDRTDLISVTTKTVLKNMVEGVILIFLVQWIFLGNLRSALIVSVTIPFAMLFAVTIMVMRGESANLLSVGAIDFGLIVDATVIMVENIYRHLAEASAGHRPASSLLNRNLHGFRGKLATIFQASTEVNKTIFFSAAIIIAGFVPLFTMGGIEGRIFGPMAKTYAYALAGGLIATFTVAPVLAAYLLPENVRETETLIVRGLRRMYRPMFHFALANRVLTLTSVVLLLGLAAVGVRGLGLEFLPKLEEGNMWIRATMPASISLEESNSYVNRMRNIIKSMPEVDTVVSQHGRPDDGTDVAGFFNAEFYTPLKPFSTWPDGPDKNRLINKLMTNLTAEFPGVEFNVSQVIEDNVSEAASGVKGENSIKLSGPDLEVLSEVANKIKASIATVPGVTDLSVFTTLGQPTIRIDVDRLRAARYGLSTGDVNTTIQVAIGGQEAGDLYEGSSDRHFPMVVRLAPKYRQSLEAIRNITIGAQGPNGIVQVPLSEVADVKLVGGAAAIYREQQQRYVPIKFSVRDRDLGSAILEAQAKVKADVQLPSGYSTEWVGQFGNLQDAMARLSVAVPLSILLILFLLYINFSSVRDMLLAASVIPMALIGGILALFVTGTPFSISAAIGFIALFGISVMDGILVLSYFNSQIDHGVERSVAIVRTCEAQLRPVMMTCVAAGVGLLPAAYSTGIGSEVQKPLALVVVGGMLLAPWLILLVLPVLIELFSRRAAPDHITAFEPAE